MSWTEDRVEQLKKYWAEGLSASQIANKLGGVTRNAVIGKVHRLGLSGRAAPSRPERGRSAPVRQKPSLRPTGLRDMKTPEEKVEAPEPVFAPPVVLQSGEKTTVATLKSGMCKWPIGDPLSDDFHFCGRPSDGNHPYCAYHTKMAFQPSQTKRDRREERRANETVVPAAARRVAGL